jgi:hypothetical protein
MWEEEYRDLRNEGCLLLDILSYFPDEASLSILKNSLNFQDSRFVFFAITGLIRKNQIPQQSAFIKVASSPETRNLLYRFLLDVDKKYLFPEKFNTQEHLAESDMVGWLIFPTELDTAPDQIELMHIATVENKDKELFNYYIFRFKTFEPHWAAKKGWLAGVSGPFPQKEMPTIKSFGSTFSRFDSWESLSAEEHLGEITETILKWQEYRKETKGK